MSSKFIPVFCFICIILSGCIQETVIPSPWTTPPSQETGKQIVDPTTILPTSTPADILELPAEQPMVKGLFDIGGHLMFLNCIGSGNQTVILEAGWNDISDTWSMVQSAAAESMRVCSYDRAGLGKSEPGPTPRTMEKEVHELHSLLKKAGIEGPFILVGHSYGGLLMRLFADLYLEKTTGIILVDSSHPDQFRRSLAVIPPASPADSEGLRFYREWFTNEINHPTLNINADLLRPGSMGDLPVIVITGMQKERRENLPEGVDAAFNQIWFQLQEELASLSTNSSQILAEESGHFIQHDQPELVIEAILTVASKND